MTKIDTTLFTINHIDDLSYQDTPIHHLDPRVKVLTTLLFIIIVVSFDKYEISALIPFVIYPVTVLAIGNIKLSLLLKKMMIAVPFALLIGIFNPILDRAPLITLGQISISGGWTSFISIMIRFFLTVGAALTLIATTGFNAVCMALEKLGTPQVFVVQLMFLYRYLFVLADETIRMHQARALRTFNKTGMGIRVFGSMVGHLLLRTLGRAQRIHLAMNCRGFDGQIKVMSHLRIGFAEIIFMIIWSTFFIVMRFYNIPRLLGILLMEYIK